MKTGWRPQRTLVFALWDGEEWGLLGSTEWAEDHADELRDKGVVYFNTDTYARGAFAAEGSHTLETFVREVARDLKDPATGLSAIDAARARKLAGAKNARDSSAINAEGFELGAAGSGTDFEAFLEHAGIASVSHGYEGGPGAGVYHSIYDSYDHFSKFMDPGYVYGVAQAAAVGTLALRMADAPVLPFSFSDAAAAYRRFAQGVVAHADESLGAERLDVGPVFQAIDRLAKAGGAYDTAYARVMRKGAAYLAGVRAPLRAINKDLYQSERDLLDEQGLPGREWFRSTMYATGIYTGFEGDPMPGVKQMVDAKNLASAQGQVQKVAAAIDRMASRAERVAASMSALAK
jgi:N-acetylated-alpha-linked acidic dipeptidase